MQNDYFIPAESIVALIEANQFSNAAAAIATSDVDGCFIYRCRDGRTTRDVIAALDSYSQISGRNPVVDALFEVQD